MSETPESSTPALPLRGFTGLSRLIVFYGDPAIGLPWVGAQGMTVLWARLKHRGFGIWLERDKYIRPELCVGVYFVYRFRVQWHCTWIKSSRIRNLFWPT